MNPLDILLVGTVGLCAGSYMLGRIHGRKRARKSAANFIKQLRPFVPLN